MHMGYAIFSIITGIITLLCTWVIVHKEKISIISGFMFLSNEDIDHIDKVLLKCFAGKALLSVAVLQIVTGVVCFFNLTGSVLIAELLFMVAICLACIFMYEKAIKAAHRYLRIHSIVSILFIAISSIVVIILAFA